MKITPSEIPNERMYERIVRQALIDGIDGSIISGGLLAEGSAQGIYEENVAQQYVLGTKMRFKDGRVFRYAKAGAVALEKALMCQGPAVVSNYVTQIQTAHGIAAGLSAGNILITTGATPAADLFKDGWLLVSKAGGMGQVRRILTSGSHATIIAVTFEGALEEAIAATSECSLIQSPFKASIVVPVTTRTNVPIGVPTIEVTAEYYYWSQTGGAAAMLVDTGDTLVIGDPVGVPATNAVAGAVGIAVTVKGRYGDCMYISAAGEAALIDLKIDS